LKRKRCGIPDLIGLGMVIMLEMYERKWVIAELTPKLTEDRNRIVVVEAISLLSQCSNYKTQY
jgi:hypothetical protein